jgi:hypothetical protein
MHGFAQRFWASRRGATAVTVGLMTSVIIGMSGFVIDVGHLIYVQRQLQASADAAALAGAGKINCCATTSAVSTANTYSAISGGKNVVSGLTATMLSGYPKLICFTSTGVSCTGVDNANGIQVKETGSVSMWFSGILGFTSFPINATATASGSGGPVKSADIMLILDTTASMNTADSSCSISGATRLTCAEAGARTLLTALSIGGDKVGLMVFPGVSSSTVAYDYDCSGTTPTSVAYNGSPTYQILGLGNDFKTSGSSSLNTGSNVVRAFGGGGTGCSSSMSAPGGQGTFFGDAITAAQTTLHAQSDSSQKVIIILSDGDASASSLKMPAGEASNQCHEAITAAQAATTAGTLVYTVAYGASTASTGSCATDTPHISACTTMEDMASSSSTFYSDQTGGTSTCTSSANPTSELVSIFSNIGSSFSAPRLVPDNTN